MNPRNMLRTLLPFLTWIGEWRQRAVVRADVVAGITVALVLIPQSMAYARLAGLPAHYGLYAALLPPAIAALFGSSRQLATGPVAMASLISAAVVGEFAPGDADAFVAYSIGVAGISGVLLLLIGVCRLGAIAGFLAHPVVVGFTNAGALIIATSQLEKIFGVARTASDFHLLQVGHCLWKAGTSAHGPTVAMSALALLLLYGVRRVVPRAPHVLIAVAVTTVLAWLTQYPGAVVGAIPRGMPTWRLPCFESRHLPQLVMGAGLITLLCLSEALAIARSIAAHTRQRLNVNQELIGQGLANLAGCCTQSFVVSGSFSRSAVNLNAGARTGMASVITSLMVVITLLWLTPLLEGLPEATLAAIIIISVLSLIKVQPFVETWRVSRQDGAVAIVTFVATLVVAPNLEYGIFTGVGLSLVLFLYRTMYPHVALLARHPDGTLRDLRVRHLQACRHIAVVRFDGQLYFGNCSFFEDKVLDTIAGNTEMRTVILDAAGINRIDASGEFTLRAVAQHLREAGIVFLIARGKHAFLRTLERAGFTALLGRDRFFHRTEDAIEYAWRDMNCNHVSQCPLYQPLPVAPATAPPA
jgi:SulP family sulfate permease